METEYRISTIYRWFYGIIALGMMVVMGFAFYAFATLQRPYAAPFLFLISFLFGGFALIFINLLTRRVIVSDHSVRLVSLFTRKELDFREIKGYRKESKLLVLEAVSPSGPVIVVYNYSLYSKNDQLVKWIAGRFTDLNGVDLKEEKHAVLESADWGYTKKERLQKLRAVRRISTGYNVFAVLVSITVFFAKIDSAKLILFFVPLMGILLILLSKGRIKLVSSSTQSVYPYIVPGLGVSCFVILTSALQAYHLFELRHLWQPAFIVSGCFFVLLSIPVLFRISGSKGPGVSASKPFLPIRTQAAIVIGLSLFYGFGSVIYINCRFDRDTPQVFQATVLRHRISGGKSTSYFLMLSVWGPSREEREIIVSKSMYRNTRIGDAVEVDYLPGLLHIPWFVVKNYYTEDDE